MTWLQRYQLASFLRSSIWVAPTVGLIMAMALFAVLYSLEGALGWKAVMSPEAARSVVGTLTSALLTFIVFVMSALLVAVQLASAQLSPRIIARAFQEQAIKVALGVFVFTFTFSIGLLARIDGTVPLFSVRVAIFGSLLCICVFLYLVDRLAKSFRPISILTEIANEGSEVIGKVYPRMLDREAHEEPPPALPAPTLVVDNHGRSRVVLAVDAVGLLRIAEEADCIIEIVPQVGDFVAHRDPIFRVLGPGQIAPHVLRGCMALGAERTIEQDPTFAFRVIVDIAIKALSPAINDPTTAVLALDQLHVLLRLVGLRELERGIARDARGNVRLVFRTPDWHDFVWLSLTEIREFGASSMQVARRMRALLEHLLVSLPGSRRACLRGELALLEASVRRSFPDPADVERGLVSDLQGLGGSPVHLAEA